MKPEKDNHIIKDQIIEASREVFKRFGYIKVSMDDISKASKKGRSTLYYYFKNKREVLEGFAEKELDNLLTAAKEALKPSLSFTKNLNAFYALKLRLYKQLLQEYHTLLIDIKSEPAFFLVKLRRVLKDEADVISNIIKWAVENREISNVAVEDIDFLSETIVTACRSFEQEIILYNGMENYEKRLRLMIDILYRGIK
jgi:AcrR family transcriptional regulator